MLSIQLAASEAASLDELLAAGNFKAGDQVFIRIFKQEGLLELWLKPEGGFRFSLFQAYPICYFFGDLGPKQELGDYQAPEGFYSVSLKSLNPQSSYHKILQFGFSKRL